MAVYGMPYTQQERKKYTTIPIICVILATVDHTGGSGERERESE